MDVTGRGRGARSDYRSEVRIGDGAWGVPVPFVEMLSAGVAGKGSDAGLLGILVAGPCSGRSPSTSAATSHVTNTDFANRMTSPD